MNILHKLRSKLSKAENSIPALIVVLAVAGIGVYFIVNSHATTPYVATSASNGTSIVSPAGTVTDSNTSSGKAVQFGCPTGETGTPGNCTSGSGSGCGNITPTPTTLQSTFTKTPFDDEFCNDTALNAKQWERCFYWDSTCSQFLGQADGSGCEAVSAQNDPNNQYVSVISDPTYGHVLYLTGSSSTPGTASSWKCGSVDTENNYATPAGNYYVEIKASLSAPGPGEWPSFVDYHCQNPAIGCSGSAPYSEFDLLERVNSPANGVQDYAAQSWHDNGGQNVGTEIGSLGVDLTGWHTYGLEVAPTTGDITYYFDGKVIATDTDVSVTTNGVTTNYALEPAFISLAETIGGGGNNKLAWAGVPSACGTGQTPPACTPNPSWIKVAYVRVFTP